jgi:hypothetical protein
MEPQTLSHVGAILAGVRALDYEAPAFRTPFKLEPRCLLFVSNDCPIA